MITHQRILGVAAALLALSISAAGGCNLVLGIHELAEGGAGPDAGSPCNVDAQCDDSNPCSIDTCKGGGCEHLAQPDGPATISAQVAFDCQVLTCVNGLAEPQDDDQDIEVDAEDCTVDSCSGGKPSHMAKPDQTLCTMGGAGTCKSGKCQVICTATTPCDDNNPCTLDSCDFAQNMCSYVPLNGENTPGVEQVVGDCKIEICVNGVSTPSPDDSDLPTTATECDEELCNKGMPSNPPLLLDTACGQGSTKYCDGAGACVECTLPSQCGVDTECLKVTCAAGACGTTPILVNTCAQGMPCAVDTNCGSGHCADGVCCNTACTTACVACTATKKGSGADGVCGSIPVNQPDTFPANACVSPKACDGASNCEKIDGQLCGADSECVSGSCADGVCCNTACTGTCQACSAAKKGSGADGVCGNIAINLPDTAGTTQCSGTSSCDGNGNCKKNVGQTCANDSQCVNANCIDGVCCGVASCPACQSCALGANGTCGDLPVGPDSVAPNICMGTSTCDGMGNCRKSNGQTCVLLQECSTGSCVDGVCCGVASCPACQSCAVGLNGTCGNIAAGPDSVSPNTCMGISACDGMGNCKKVNGQTCAATSECATGSCVDGVCCGVASCPACQSCALGGGGTCGPIGSGMPDSVTPNTCTGTSTCDGSGNCKKVNGQTCAAPSDCATGSCVDGVCCGVTSCAACQSCALGVMPGTCGNIASGQPDNVTPNTCTSTSICDGAGNCKKVAGQFCLSNGECASGVCAANVCQ